jgi:hypothetical protein
VAVVFPALMVGVVGFVVFETVSPLAFVNVIWKPAVPPNAEDTVAAVVMLATKLMRHIPMAYADPDGTIFTADCAALCAVLKLVVSMDASPFLVVALPA